MLKINKYGLIENGMAIKRIAQRRTRVKGSYMAWNDIKDTEYVKIKNGWYQILKVPQSRGWGKYHSGDAEIGALRMIQTIFPKLIKDKTKFRLKWMENWIEGIAAAEFFMSMESPLSLITPGEKVVTGLQPPTGNDDEVYCKIYKVKRGLCK